MLRARTVEQTGPAIEKRTLPADGHCMMRCLSSRMWFPSVVIYASAGYRLTGVISPVHGSDRPDGMASGIHPFLSIAVSSDRIRVQLALC